MIRQEFSARVREKTLAHDPNGAVKIGELRLKPSTRESARAFLECDDIVAVRVTVNFETRARCSVMRRTDLH